MQLKEGERNPPVFLAHGIGGGAMDFTGLVKNIQLSHAIYAMEATGNDGISEPLRSIEEMARVYLNAIKRVQPKGPYLLIGYSLGGLVSLEVAQLLSRDGDRVALLALVDSYPHFYRLSIGQRVRLIRRLVKRRASSILHWTAKRKRNVTGLRAGRSTASLTSPATRRVLRAGRIALKKYQPQFYEGSIRFIKAKFPTRFPDDPIPVWKHLAAEFEVEAVPGDHVTMLTRHSETLASVLARHISVKVLEISCEARQ